MNFLETIFEHLRKAGNTPVLQEVRDGKLATATGVELMASVRAARSWVAHMGLKKGDRCALLAPNSVAWAAVDVALMAEGIIVVPLYSRQAPAELVGMMKDAEVSAIVCGSEALRETVAACWPDAPPVALLAQVLAGDRDATDPGIRPQTADPSDPVTIIYTSGTSGEPKGVVLTVANISHMLRCTTARLDQLMALEKRNTAPVVGAGACSTAAIMPGAQLPPEQVFHYLPFCFAGSWILLLSCLSRNAVLTLSTDLSKLAEEMTLAAPQYFLNVPTLLERVRAGIEQAMKKRGGLVTGIFQRSIRTAAACARGEAKPGMRDRICLALAERLLFPAIRKQIGPRLRALICGSAPLAFDTQLFFQTLGISVLQVYGLTETTAICTMDEPGHVVPGLVGPAIPGIEMRVDDEGQIIVRGPNIFAGYWRRPEQTASTFRDGWFLSGDQGEVDAAGNWKIVGRVKNLIVLNSGHKVPPEPLEEALVKAIPGAQQVVLVGSGRSFLAAIVTGAGVQAADVQRALDAKNQELPHYKRIHAFHLEAEPFTIENGLLTANGKLKRDAIAARLKPAIDALYGAAKAG